MRTRRESPLVRPPVPPDFDDENDASVAGGLYAISWSLLLVVLPLLFIVAWLVPELARAALTIALWQVVIAVGGILLVRIRQVTAASLWLLATNWLLFFNIIWNTGGLRSAAVVSLFVIVILAGAVKGWRWGVVTAAAGVASIALLMWASIAGFLPPNSVQLTPITAGATYAVYFIALGALQGVIAVSVQRARDRAAQEGAQRRAAERRLLDVVGSAPFGALVAELSGARGLTITHMNRAAGELLGVDEGALIGKRLETALESLTGTTPLVRFEEIAREGGTFHTESVAFYSEGRRGLLEMNAFQIADGSMAVFFSDVTARRRAHAEMHRMAFHDELTSLPNRKLLFDRLEMALAGARRRGTTVALLFIDLDDFKPINDRLGHSFGDALLVAVGTRLRAAARETDTVARFGGDEFTVLMPDLASPEQVEVVADKILAAMREPFEVEGRVVTVTASIGVGLSSDGATTADRLLERADMAMYQVKRAGRDGFRIG